MILERWIKKNSPKPVLNLLRTVRYEYVTRVTGFADAVKLIDPEDIYDEGYYVKRQTDPWRSDARVVAEAVRGRYDPESVIDFGCAIGNHLEPFYEDERRIQGVEGNVNALQHAVVPSMHIDHHDLREPYETDEKYDVALCFEVAEHIPKTHAETLVDTLSGAGDTVVMTAATPGQQGTHHVNLQPRSYWRERFERRGMTYDDDAVSALREEMDVTKTTWIPQNLMVFSSRST